MSVYGATKRGTRRATWKAVVIIVPILAIILVGSFALGFFTEGLSVAQEELGPRAINQKYEWFKRAASQIRANSQNVDVLVARNESFVSNLPEDREKWYRTDRETMAQYQSESSGTVLMYNRLVGEYNAEMSMWHTRFTNFGKMPAGWEDITPDKFPEYRIK